MKRKSFLAMTGVALLLVLLLSVLTACNKNKHEFSAEWNRDDTSHWHACTTEKHDDVADKADHTFDNGVITTPPTETTEGVRTYTCTVCGYRKTESVDKLEHVHTFNRDVWDKDENDHWHPATCAHTDRKDSLGKHMWDEGVITTPPTETSEGVRTYTCTVCGYQKTESVDKSEHVHTFDRDVWDKDENDHWHPATCAHTEQRDAVAPHDWNDGETTTPAGYGTAGEKTFTCKTCFAIKTEPIAALDAKDNSVTLADGITLGKMYDGTPYALTVDGIVRFGDGQVTFAYKAKAEEDETYTAEAPKNAGEYTVRVSVLGTAEWKAAEATFDFTIEKKALTATATKVYDGNATLSADVVGVIEGDTVTATVTMSDKNVGASVASVKLNDDAERNYTLAKDAVTASITPFALDIEAEKPYDNTDTILVKADGVEGDDVTVTLTMTGSDVGAEVKSFTLFGADAANYSLASENVTAVISRADIGDDFTIRNGDFAETYIVGSALPDPTTAYAEIGSGYGARSVVWEKSDGTTWKKIAKGSVIRARGQYRVSIRYEEGQNYNEKNTPYITFLVLVKERSVSTNPITTKQYDGKTVNMSFASVATVAKNGNAGTADYTALSSGVQVVKLRKKGESAWTIVESSNQYPKDAGVYEYCVSIGETDEWGLANSAVATFTIKKFEFVIESGYVENQHNPSHDRKTFKLRTFGKENGNALIENETIQIWLDNEKAGLKTKNAGQYDSFVPDQKKSVPLDCFFLKVTSTSGSVNMDNYTIVKKYSTQTAVEMTVVYSTAAASKTGKIEKALKTTTTMYLYTTVSSGYFKVGQKVVVKDPSGNKLFEATITKVSVCGGTITPGSGTLPTAYPSASGCVIPSDGLVSIELDITGITSSGAIQSGSLETVK